MQIKENIVLAPYTVFKVGGPARFFVEVKTVDELTEAVGWAKGKSLPIFILGLGSNILVSDKGFIGLVIKMELQNLWEFDANHVRAGAGASMALAVSFALEKGLTGFEWGIGVPGTIGGSLRGNAGCFGKEMKDVVESVEIIDIDAEPLKFGRMRVAECEFEYRESIFKKRPELIVLSVTLKLDHGNVVDARKQLAEFTKKRVESQDIGAKTAGSVFKNVEWKGTSLENMRQAGSGPKENVAVGYLLEQVGLKGFKIGGAIFSEKHANFLVNTGSATAENIVELISLAKERVFEQFGIRLEEEIQYVGF